MDSLTCQRPGATFTVRIGDPFTVCQADEVNDPRHCRIHPNLHRLPGGRLVLTVNIDGDIVGAEYRALASDDAGTTWRGYADWPATDGPFVALDDGSCLLVAGGSLYESAAPGSFHLPTWRSSDGGLTWGAPEAAHVELPLDIDAPFDHYDPPTWALDRTVEGVSARAWLAKWQKSHPSAFQQEMRARLGRKTIGAFRLQLLPLGGAKLLAFFYLSLKWGQPLVTVCLTSEDAGHTWSYRSTPGPDDPRFATHGYLRHALDGLCEPSCTRLATGDLYLVMRLGSYHPLYATCSGDDGRTWAPPADLRPGCYYAGWPARPLAIHGILPTVLTLPDGTLALCTGRPDVTLSLSFDHGYHWPWTYRFLEDNKPEEQGTYNNAMIQVAPGRLLIMYDHGGNSGKVPEYSGPRRIVGQFVEVEGKRARQT